MFPVRYNDIISVYVFQKNLYYEYEWLKKEVMKCRSKEKFNSYGNERFKNVKLAYDFYKNHKDDVVTITIETMGKPDDGKFLNTIDFGYDVFYIETDDNFKEYMHR